MKLEHLTVEVRDRDYVRVGVIGHEHLDLQFTARLCDVGEWTIVIPDTHPMGLALSQPGSGVVIHYRDICILSGPMTSAEVESAEGGVSIRTIKGVCDNIHLEDRLANASLSSSPLDSSTGLTGFWEPNDIPTRAMAFGVQGNAMNSAHVSRRHPHLALWRSPVSGGAWEGSSDPVALKVRYESLLTVCRSLVERGGAPFEIRQGSGAFAGDSTNRIVFRPINIIDTDDKVRFDNSLVGGIESSGATIAAPTITRALIGGTGHLNFRVLKESKVNPSIENEWGRIIERFGDERSSVAEQGLTEAGMEMLAEGGKTQVAQNIELTDDTRYEYGVDYTLGSEIVLINGNDETRDTCREVSVIVDRDGMRCGIKVGEKDPDENKILARVANLERIEITGAGPWHDLSVLGAWSASPFQQPQFRVNNGEVVLRGGIQGGAPGQAVSLPSSIQPSRNEQFLQTAASGGVRITVEAGASRINVDNYIDGGDNTSVSLTGIRYYLS